MLFTGYVVLFSWLVFVWFVCGFLGWLVLVSVVLGLVWGWSLFCGEIVGLWVWLLVWCCCFCFICTFIDV